MGYWLRDLATFNKSLIARPIWRILVTIPHSLISKYFKVVYLPNVSIFDASMEKNPSSVEKNLSSACLEKVCFGLEV